MGRRARPFTEPLGLRTLTWAPEFSAQDMASLQAEDDDIYPVIQWLNEDLSPTADELRTYPLSVRNLWAQRADLQFRDNVLVCLLPDRTQLVVPQSLRKTLLDHVHAGPMSAYLAAEKTLLQLKQCYYWSVMRKDVESWYRQCVDCARGRSSPHHPHGKLTKVIVGEPLDVVAVDILSGLPSTPENYKYIFVVTDYFTKSAEAYPLKDSEAPTCMRSLYNNFL